MIIQAKHEKILIPKGRMVFFKGVLASLKKEDKKFKKLMDKLPPIQKLSGHSYCYVPIEYSLKLLDRYNQQHYQKYGYVD